MFSIACLRFLNVQMSGIFVKRTLSSTKYIKILSQEKKLKLERDDVTSPLSPEQLERISKNKKAALERLAANQAEPNGIGESWMKALSAEFGKPYFKLVSNYLTHEELI